MFENLNMTLRAGECHCLTGPTGSGKSTLLMAIKGLLPLGETTGQISTSFIQKKGIRQGGVVLQNPDIQLFRPTIGTEAAFGLENIGIPSASMAPTVHDALSALGVDKPLSAKVSTLSMGQKYRLLLAGMMAMGHQLLLLDEPGAQLAPDGITRLKKWLYHLKSKQISILISEHHPEEFKDLVDVYWALDPPKGLLQIPAPTHVTSSTERADTSRTPSNEKEILVSNLWPPKDVDASIWSDLNFSVCRGERVAIFGTNGSGKSTLINCLIGFLKPSKGSVTLWGQPPTPGGLRGHIGYLSQSPHKQLFETTVHDELAFSLKRFGNHPETVDERVSQTLADLDISHLADASPHKLSFGQQHLVALASVLAFSPKLLVLDDPFAGLDRSRQAHIQELLSRLNQDKKTTIVWTSHRPKDLENWATTTLSLTEGG